MNHQAPQPASGALDKLGQALGIALGFIGTAPLGHLTYPYFFEYAMQHADRQYWYWMEIGWNICLFFLIFALTWTVLNGVVAIIRKAVLFLALSLRIRKERSRW